MSLQVNVSLPGVCRHMQPALSSWCDHMQMQLIQVDAYLLQGMMIQIVLIQIDLILIVLAQIVLIKDGSHIDDLSQFLHVCVLHFFVRHMLPTLRHQ